MIYMKKIITFLLLLLSSNISFSQTSRKAKDAKDLQWSQIADSLQDATFKLYLASDGKYFVQDNTGNTRFNYWWNAHALDVLVDGYLRSKDQAYIGKMKALLEGIKDTNGGTYYNDFYDDMEWLALASVRAFEATKDREFMNVADLLWKDIQTAYNDIQGGGFAWRKSQTYYKNTPANAPAIILAARLYRTNKRQSDLMTAKKLYEWLKKTLVDPNNGFVKDGINREQDGKIDLWKLTYNQGVFIGAGLELFDLTNEKSYLNEAIQTADFVVNDREFSPGGILKSEGEGDGGLFKGILIRYLELLSQHKTVPKNKAESYKAFIKNNAESLLRKGIKRPEMLVGTNWTLPPENKTDFSTQLSGIMLIEAMTRLN
jgi:predicted alpha-1,6-mannanase (GH76 family)